MPCLMLYVLAALVCAVINLVAGVYAVCACLYACLTRIARKLPGARYRQDAAVELNAEEDGQEGDEEDPRLQLDCGGEAFMLVTL